MPAGKRVFQTLIGLWLVALPWASVHALSNPWADVKTPLGGAPQVIGGYTAGCLKGAVSLLADEGDFHLMRKSRRRYFVHPSMRNTVTDLAAYVKKNGYGKLLVGDQAQARADPAPPDTPVTRPAWTAISGSGWIPPPPNASSPARMRKSSAPSVC